MCSVFICACMATPTPRDIWVQGYPTLDASLNALKGNRITVAAQKPGSVDARLLSCSHGGGTQTLQDHPAPKPTPNPQGSNLEVQSHTSS